MSNECWAIEKTDDGIRKTEGGRTNDG